MNIKTKEIIDSMLKKYNASHVCQENTDLVIEGFPRSSNTFTVDYINYLFGKQNIKFNIAHHTHSILNIKLAIQLKKPCLVLIREPVAAIISYVIYSNFEISKIVQKYYNFYKNIDKFENDILVVDFDLIVKDFNVVVKEINKKFGLTVPLSGNIGEDNAKVSFMDKERARRSRKGDEYVRTVGSPIIGREKLKDSIRPKVLDYLAAHKNVTDKYSYVKGLYCCKR